MRIAIKLAALLVAIPQAAKADFPLLWTSVVIPGCQIARSMDGSDASLTAASRMFAKDPRAAMAAAYCAAWATEAFDRYADRPNCFSNDMSIDDLILVVINYALAHPEFKKMPFVALASGAILDRWPECVSHEKQG